MPATVASKVAETILATRPKAKTRRMPPALYIVINSLDKWWIDFEGKPYGPFPDQEEARSSAIEIARVFGDELRVREVIIMRSGHAYEVVWSSARPVPA